MVVIPSPFTYIIIIQLFKLFVLLLFFFLQIKKSRIGEVTSLIHLLLLSLVMVLLGFVPMCISDSQISAIYDIRATSRFAVLSDPCSLILPWFDRNLNMRLRLFLPSLMC